MLIKERRALLWLTVDVAGSQFLPLIAFLVIATLVPPEDYGIFALSMGCVGLVNVVLYQGLSEALIQGDEPDSRDLSTSFWMNVALSVAIFLAFQASAGLIAKIYDAPRMEAVIRWLSLTAPLQGLATVLVAVHRRTLDTGTLARRTVVGRISGAAAGIIAAVYGCGMWSMVIMQLTQATIGLVMLWSGSTWYPRLSFSPKRALEYLNFGGHYLGGTFATALVGTVDSLIVGMFFDPRTVGAYALASRLLDMVNTLVLAPVRLLMLPILARTVGNSEQFVRSYKAIVTSTFILWMPAVLGVGMTAVMVPIIFGEAWAGAVPIIQALSLTGFTTPLWCFAGQALAAKGRPEWFMRLAALQVLVVATCVLVGAKFGIVAVALGCAAGSLIMVPITLATLDRACGLSWKIMSRHIAKLFVCGIPLLVGLYMAPHHSVALVARYALVKTFVGAGLSAVAYLAFVEWIIFPQMISSALAGWREALLPKNRQSRPTGWRPR